MKLKLSKFAAAVGLAGALAAPSANADIQLLIYGSNGTTDTLLFAGTQAGTADPKIVSFSGVVNGWYISATAGQLDANPYTLTITGSVRRVTAADAAGSNLCGSGDFNYNPSTTTCGTPTWTAANNQFPNGTTRILAVAPVAIAPANWTDGLKIRLNDYAFPIPTAYNINVQDVLSLTSTPMNNATSQLTMWSDGSTPGGQQLGEKTYDGATSGYLETKNYVFNNVSAPTTGTLGTQIDFTLPTTSTSFSNAFSFTNTVTLKVSEPASLALLGLGLIGAGMVRRRRQKLAA